MWMSHPSLAGVVKSVTDSAFYGGWDTVGWVAAAAPVGPPLPDAGWPISQGELDAALAANDLVDAATYARRGTAATAALVRKMRTGLDGANATVLGDSTANESNEWFQKTLVALAARFPTYRVTNRLWNDTNQAYDAETVLQAGSGVARNLYATQSNGAYITTPDSAATSITGDIDIHVKAMLDDWTPATAFELCGKTGASPQVGWFLRINTTGTLTLFWSADGTTTLSATSSASVPFADGTVGWVRATLDVDNGAAGKTTTFYTSTDGTAWTILGAAQTAATITALFDSTAALQFIGRGTTAGLNSTSGMAGYQMRVYSGIGGTLVADLDVADAPNSQTPWTDSKGVVWTPTTGSAGNAGEMRGTPTLALYNGSAPGQAIAYSNDGTRFPKQTPQQSMDVAFLNYGHNEGTVTAYRTVYKQLADALVAKWPDVGVVASTQNPQTAPRTVSQINAHASRTAVIRSLAASQRYGLVDAYDAFIRSSQALAALVNAADGVHPQVAGSDLWAAEAGYLFAPS